MTTPSIALISRVATARLYFVGSLPYRYCISSSVRSTGSAGSGSSTAYYYAVLGDRQLRPDRPVRLLAHVAASHRQGRGQLPPRAHPGSSLSQTATAGRSDLLPASLCLFTPSPSPRVYDRRATNSQFRMYIKERRQSGYSPSRAPGRKRSRRLAGPMIRMPRMGSRGSSSTRCRSWSRSRTASRAIRPSSRASGAPRQK